MSEFNYNKCTMAYNYYYGVYGAAHHPDQSFVSQESSDRAFLESWSSSVRIAEKNITPKSKLSQFSIKRSIVETLELCQQLKNYEVYLRDNVSLLSSEEFDEKIQLIDGIKSRIRTTIAILNDDSLINSTKRKLAKRINKRARRKRIKVERAKQKEIVESQSQQTAEWIRKVATEFDQKRKNEELKAKADATLKDVNKRKAEAKRYILLLNQLCKLRDAREKAAIGRGESVVHSDKTLFLTSIEKLKCLWEKAYAKYTLEESTLKKMLEKDNNVTDEPDSGIAENTCVTLTAISQWKNVMFGSAEMHPQSDSHTSINQLICVRKQWDQYACLSGEEGTRIPFGWLTPLLPSKGWEDYVDYKF